MPTYKFKNKTTGVEWEKEMKISELDDYKKENNCSIVIGVPTTISGTKSLWSQTDDGFKDRMKEIEKTEGKMGLKQTDYDR